MIFVGYVILFFFASATFLIVFEAIVSGFPDTNQIKKFWRKYVIMDANDRDW
jgi:hypothetical protein